MNFQDFKSLIIYKTQWLKNASDKGGAQDLVISCKPEKNVVIKSVSKKNGQMWADVSPKELLKLVEKDAGVQEVLSQFPYKAYFDIDEPSKDTALLDKVVKLIDEYFPNGDLAVSGSINPKKTSYHVALNNYLITSKEDLKYFKLLVKLLKEQIASIDDKVYGSNRNLKAINQSKTDGRVQKIVINNDPKKHLVSCFFNQNTLPLPKYELEAQEEIKLKVDVQKAKKPFCIGTLPKLAAQQLDEYTDVNELTPLDLLALLPLNKEFDHSYTHLIARFCFYNNLSFENFLSWYQSKSTDEQNKKKLQSHWAKLNQFPQVSKQTIINVLSNFYPTIKKSIKAKTFEKLFDLPTNKIEVIDNLDQSVFETEEKFVILNTAMGSGKTHQTIDYLKDKQSFIWMTPIIALAQNTKHRLTEKQIDCLYYKDNKKKLDTADRLIVCINSLEKTQDKVYKVVVVDEIETLLHKWFNNKTLNDSNVIKLDCWERFINILRQAEKVIFLDAFTSKITTSFIEHLQSDYKIYNSPQPTNRRTIKYLADFNHWLQDIITDLKANKKPFIFFPFKTSYAGLPTMDELVNIIQTKSNKKGVFYNAEQDDQILEGLQDVNKSWSNVDFVLTNSKITVGINYELKDFDNVFISVAGFSSSRDLIQVSYRCRNLKTNLIKVCYIDKENNVDTSVNDNHLVNNCPIYKNLVSNLLLEKQAPLQSSFTHFCKLAGYTFSSDPILIDKELNKYFKKVFDESHLDYSYDTIKTITEEEYSDYERRIFNREASLQDKVIVRKYWYQRKFKPNSSSDLLAEAWEKRYTLFFDGLTQLLKDKSNVFEKIRAFNNWESMIPTDIELNKVKLDTDLTKEIFEKFHFANLTEKSSKSIIIKNIYNAFFGKKLIDSKTDKSKNVKYFISDTTRRLYTFGVNNLVIDKKQPTDINCDPFAEDSLLDKGIVIEEEVKPVEIKVEVPKLTIKPRINFTIDFNNY